MFKNFIHRHDEDWYKLRTLVNPVLLKPKTMKLYIPQVDEIAQDFIKMVMKKRDSNNEVPANFSEILNLWSLESIACISLNQRLGLLNENYHDENAAKMIKVCDDKITENGSFVIKLFLLTADT
jgi:cytochrome P450 family 12